MDGEDTHASRAGIVRGDLTLVRRVAGVGITQRAQLVDEARQARIAPAVDIQCQQQQRAQVGLDAGSGRLGNRHSIAREDFALVKDPIEQIVRRQAIGRRQPFAEQARRTREFRRGLAIGRR